jgi:hypothetical protein
MPLYVVALVPPSSSPMPNICFAKNQYALCDPDLFETHLLFLVLLSSHIRGKTGFCFGVGFNF